MDIAGLTGSGRFALTYFIIGSRNKNLAGVVQDRGVSCRI